MEATTATTEFEISLAQIREEYCQQIDGLMDQLTAHIILPEQKANIIADAALFTVFSMTVKIAETMGARPDDRKAIMDAYWPLEKALKADLPRMINEFVDAAKEARASMQ